MPEDQESKENKESTHQFSNKARPDYTPFLNEDVKFVHISPERLQRWIDNDPSIIVSNEDLENGVVLIGEGDLEHTRILAEGLGIDYDELTSAEKDRLLGFGVQNAGHMIKTDGEIFLGGNSYNLESESQRITIGGLKKDKELARELDQITVDFLNRIYGGNYKFVLLPSPKP